jgi:hypothetical protein
MLKIVVQILSKRRRIVDQPNLLPDAVEGDDENQELDG